MSEDPVIVITSAITTAFIDHPGSGHGNQAQQEKEKLINESGIDGACYYDKGVF